MKKILTILIALALIIGAAVYIQKTDSKNDTKGTDEVVKIGLSLPLTGGVAFLGEPAQKAAQLALKDAGKTKYNYELVFEDDQFNPKTAVTTANKLMSVDNVLALISFGSGTGNSIKSVAESSQTVQFALASDPTIAEGEYNYIHWTPAFEQGKLLAQEVVRRGYTKISIIDTNHPGPLATTDAIKAALVGTGVEIVSYDTVMVGSKDFRTTANKVKSANPEIIILQMFSPEIEIAAKQLRELGVDVPVTSVESFAWSSEPELFEGMWFIADTVVPEFAAKYAAEYGVEPPSGSSYVYDIVSYLIHLQENEKTIINSEDLPAIIAKDGVWKSSVFGNTEIDEDGFFLTEASVRIIRGGKVVTE